MRSRGYHATEQAFVQQISSLVDQPIARAFGPAEIDDDYRNMVLMLKAPLQYAAGDAQRYHKAFSELRHWVDGSLDIYKTELHAVLYPIFVHCFLEMVRLEQPQAARQFLNTFSEEYADAPPNVSTTTKQEIMALSGISTPHHLQQNTVANLFLANRYELHLSSFSYSLLVAFLHDETRRHLLLRILNQRCTTVFDKQADDIIRSSGFTQKADKDRPREDGFSHAKDRESLLENDILWGRLRPELYMIPDDFDPKKKKTAPEKPKPGDPKKPEAAKKEAKDDAVEEPHTGPDGTINISRVPLKRYRYGAPGLESAQDRKHCANFARLDHQHALTKDLAVLCYTFTNVSKDGINCSAISEDGSQLAAGFGDSTVRVWDAKRAGTAGSGEAGISGRPLRLIGHSGPVYCVDWTKCSRFLVSGSEDGSLRLWSVDYKTDVAVYHGHNYPVWSTAFSPLDHYFASGSHDRTVRLWTTNRVYPLRILSGHFADVDSIAWHPNCNYIASGSSDRTARLWDLRDGKCVRVFSGHSGTIYSMAFSPDGQTLACGGDDAAITIWDIRMGKRLKKLCGHRSTVWTMDYSREGGLFVSGGADNRVCVWRATDWSKVVEGFAEERMGGNGGNGNGEDKEGDKDKDKDGDGDAKMTNADGSSNGKQDGGDSDAKKQADADGGDGNSDGDKKKNESGKQGKSGSAAVGPVLLETLKTKETGVHTLKFTRRNVLVAAGTFGS